MSPDRPRSPTATVRSHRPHQDDERDLHPRPPGSHGPQHPVVDDNAAAISWPPGARTLADVEVITRLEALRLLVDDAIAGGPTLSLPGLLLIKGFALCAFDAMEEAEAA